MKYKHSEGYAVKQIKKLKAEALKLIREAIAIEEGVFNGYNSPVYKHSEKWLWKKHNKDTSRVRDIQEKIVKIKEDYCIYI